MRQMFTVHTLRRKKTELSPIILNLFFEDNSFSEITWPDYRVWIVFAKLRFQNVFLLHDNEKAVFKPLRFEARFGKALFSWWNSVDGRRNQRNKAAFSWRISVDGRPNRRNKAPLKFLWHSVEPGLPL